MTGARSKVVSGGDKRRPPAAGKGRPKGSKNKITRDLKDMVMRALTEAGGVAYLVRCATGDKTATAFLALVGKVLPLQVTGADGRTLAQELAALNEGRQHGD
jgi:hypothetical protein